MSSEDSSERMKQLRTLASYAFVLGLGAYLGYGAAGPLGAVAGIVLAIPIALAVSIGVVVAVAWLLLPHSEDEHGS